MKVLVALAAASLVAGCVQPVYTPGPFELQNYGALPYRTAPAYREPLPPPVPMPLPDAGPAPLAEPLPPPTATDPAADASGPIPLQDMPQPVPEGSAPAAAAPPDAAPAPVMQRMPTAGPGSNVPLEGFRPMRGQVRPTP